MSVFTRDGKWVSKFVLRHRQRWTPGGPWPMGYPRGSAGSGATLPSATETGERAGAKERRKNAESKPHTVYLLYAGDRIVYVGLTGAGVRRMSEHRQLRAWWPEITRAEFRHFRGYAPAAAEEARLIRELLPPGNGKGKRRSTTPPGRPLPKVPLGSGR